MDASVVTKSTAIDSTYIEAQRAAFGEKRGRQIQAIGRSRGGWTTKIHALTDVVGRPYVLMLTAGNVSDVKRPRFSNVLAENVTSSLAKATMRPAAPFAT